MDDLAPGQMKAVQIGKTKVLLIRTLVEVFVLWELPAHMRGAELENGLLCEDSDFRNLG